MRRKWLLVLLAGFLLAALSLAAYLMTVSRTVPSQQTLAPSEQSPQEATREPKKVQVAQPGEVVGIEWPAGSRVSLYLGEQRDFASGTKDDIAVIQEDVGPEETQAFLRPKRNKGGTFAPKGTFTSSVVKSPIQFDKIAIHGGLGDGGFEAWMGALGPLYQKHHERLGGVIHLQVRFSRDAKDWSEWKAAPELPQSLVLGHAPTEHTVKEIHLPSPVRYLQYRVSLSRANKNHAPIFRGLPATLYQFRKVEVHYAKGRVELVRLSPKHDWPDRRATFRIRSREYEVKADRESKGDTVYGTLSIHDVADPSRPRVVGRCQLKPFHFVEGLALSGTHAYLAYVEPYSGDRGLWISDLSAPFRPRLLKSQIGVPAEDVFVSGKYLDAVSAWFDTGLFVFDISNPSKPKRVGQAESYGGEKIWVSRNLAYIAGEHGPDAPWGLDIVDVTQPAKPTGVFLYRGLGHIEEVRTEGEYIVVKAFDVLSQQYRFATLKYTPD